MEKNDKVKAYLCELIQEDVKHIDENGVETIKKGEHRKIWFKTADYGPEQLDYGKYWENDDTSCLNVVAEGNVEIVDDAGTLSDRLEMGFDKDFPWPKEPGEWVELPGKCVAGYAGRWTLKVTAFAELPKISREDTVSWSDLSKYAKSRICINGEPLYRAGTLESGVQAWFPNLANFIVGAVEDKLQAKGGPTATVSLHGGKFSVSDGGTMLVLDLKAKSKEGLVEFLRGIGVCNPETVKVMKTEGNAEGVTCVYTMLTGTDYLNG